MTNKQAIRIAIEAIENKRKKYAVDAYIFKAQPTAGPHFENSAKEYDKLTAAIEVLSSLGDIR